MSLQSLVAAFASIGLSSSDSNEDKLTVTALGALLEQLYLLQNRSNVAGSCWNKSIAVQQQDTTERSNKDCTSSADLATCDNSNDKNSRAVRVELTLNLLLNLYDL